MATKPTSIKGTECKSRGCSLKAVSSLRKSLPVLLIPFPQFCRNILATSRFNKAPMIATDAEPMQIQCRGRSSIANSPHGRDIHAMI